MRIGEDRPPRVTLSGQNANWVFKTLASCTIIGEAVLSGSARESQAGEIGMETGRVGHSVRVLRRNLCTVVICSARIGSNCARGDEPASSIKLRSCVVGAYDHSFGFHRGRGRLYFASVENLECFSTDFVARGCRVSSFARLGVVVLVGSFSGAGCTRRSIGHSVTSVKEDVMVPILPVNRRARGSGQLGCDALGRSRPANGAARRSNSARSSSRTVVMP